MTLNNTIKFSWKYKVNVDIFKFRDTFWQIVCLKCIHKFQHIFKHDNLNTNIQHWTNNFLIDGSGGMMVKTQG